MTTPDPNAEAPSDLAEAIGRLAGNWAALEIIVDMFVAVVFHEAGGSKRATQPIPITLKKKTEFIKTGLREYPALRPYRDQARNLMIDIDRLSNERNFILHGILWSHIPDTQGRYEFRKFEFSGRSRHTLVNRWLDVSDVVARSNQILRIKADIFRLLLEIGDDALGLWIDKTTP